ncbi:alcohol-forming fatty acyl-CoA reductase-like isoform X1 [Tasmannia lanceolata]|uniref:alcohol-forming fatty acyl-CoA reductase-like isoform X1 n=1 Tax=Tasmannia lanceolata TaxID=3420 RepID=UPI004062939F
MDLDFIIRSLALKSILVTGSTGFLAKIFVEKVLRVQPDVKRLYLLLRAGDVKSATQRFEEEVIGKEVFRVLREKHDSGFDSFISDKVTIVAGDITYENLGITDRSLNEEMWGELDAIINVAATTNFNERYDVALHINTLGAKHVLEFAKQCVKLKMLLHVSTAFVSGEKAGLILEKPLHMGDTLNGRTGLDIESEVKLVEERLKELRAEGVTGKAETIAMKEMGIKRARLFGWSNTYVFTKALGEMLLGHLRGNLPLVILRPTIITSTYREPFPGWIEGTRTIDSLIVGYGKGKLQCFMGNPDLVGDLIPGDMVVNAMLVMMVAHWNQPSEVPYHVGSSVRNPVQYSVIVDCTYNYFCKNPRIDKNGKPIRVYRVPVFDTLSSFHRYLGLRYTLPLKGLRLVNAAFCQFFDRLYNDLNHKYNFVLRLIDIYGPYLFFEGSFDDINTERLRVAMKDGSKETKMLCFDPKCIDWEDYFTNIHIPGVVKYLFK